MMSSKVDKRDIRFTSLFIVVLASVDTAVTSKCQCAQLSLRGVRKLSGGSRNEPIPLALKSIPVFSPGGTVNKSEEETLFSQSELK